MSDEVYTSIWPRVHGLRVHTRTSTAIPRATRPVVLVHGLGVSADYMLPTLVSLATDFKVWAPELPGFGTSDKPSHVLDIGELADVLAEWVRVIDVPSAVFLGNSLGCQVIVDLAVRHPKFVDAVILVGPTIDVVGHTMIQQVRRGLRDLMHEPWSLWIILARDYLRTGTRRIYRTMQFALRDDVMARSQETPRSLIDRILALSCYMGGVGTLSAIAYELGAEGLNDVSELTLLSGETLVFVGLACIFWRPR